jgi:hypothetical protein
MKKLIIIIYLIIPSLTIHAQDFTPVTMLIPAFQSPKGARDVGWRTASVLGLQIWRTYSTSTQKPASFDTANFNFALESRPKTVEEVEALARRQFKKTNLVLWGKAWKYGDGIVVESSLLVRKDMSNALGTNIWNITIPTSKKSYTISVDIPEWQYDFAPIVLNPKVVLKLTSPNPLNIYTNGTLQIEIYEGQSTSSKVIGSFSHSEIVAMKHYGDWSRVLVDYNRFGWVYLPDLSQNPSEVVNFCSGIIRILRKDWPGAVSIFQDVLKNSGAPTAIKIDSYLYMAIAYDKMHDETKSFAMVAEAYNLNPYSKTTTKYLSMIYLAKLARALPYGTQGAEAKKIIQSTQELLSNNKILFAENDVWIMQVEQILAALKD